MPSVPPAARLPGTAARCSRTCGSAEWPPCPPWRRSPRWSRKWPEQRGRADVGAQQHLAQHDEQRNRHQQEFIVRTPRQFADGARQRQHGEQRVQRQAQHAQGGAHRNGQADQHQQKNQGGGDHAASPLTMRSPAAASSSASSCAERTPQICLTSSMSPVTSAAEARASISATVRHIQARPSSHRPCGIHSGVARGVLAADFCAQEVCTMS